MHLTKTNPLATELQTLPIRPCLGQGLWKVGLFIYKTGGGGGGEHNARRSGLYCQGQI